MKQRFLPLTFNMYRAVVSVREANRFTYYFSTLSEKYQGMIRKFTKLNIS